MSSLTFAIQRKSNSSIGPQITTSASTQAASTGASPSRSGNDGRRWASTTMQPTASRIATGTAESPTVAPSWAVANVTNTTTPAPSTGAVRHTRSEPRSARTAASTA